MSNGRVSWGCEDSESAVQRVSPHTRCSLGVSDFLKKKEFPKDSDDLSENMGEENKIKETSAMNEIAGLTLKP